VPNTICLTGSASLWIRRGNATTARTVRAPPAVNQQVVELPTPHPRAQHQPAHRRVPPWETASEAFILQPARAQTGQAVAEQFGEVALQILDLHVRLRPPQPRQVPIAPHQSAVHHPHPDGLRKRHRRRQALGHRPAVKPAERGHLMLPRRRHQPLVQWPRQPPGRVRTQRGHQILPRTEHRNTVPPKMHQPVPGRQRVRTP
jgi:hypothetical protein